MRLSEAQPGNKETASRAAAKATPVAGPAPPARDVRTVVLLAQRTRGNQFVQRLLKAGVIRPKLTVSHPEDSYEQEADRVADAVMRMADPKGDAGAACGMARVSRLQRKCSACEEEELQREAHDKGGAQTVERESLEVSPEVESGIEALGGGGSALPDSLRAFFEPRFGHDFGHVRVHTGGEAARLARAVNARAFTVGRDVVFGSGEYAPETTEGKRLLAHELTHVIQQGSATRRSVADVQLTPGKPSIQRAWSLTSSTVTSDQNVSLRGNSSAPHSFLSNGVNVRAEAWQTKQRFEWCVYGGIAQLHLWKATQFTFTHDGADNQLLELSVTGSLFGGAKAEDLHYAQSGAAVVGLLKVRTPANPTPPPTRVFTISEGGKSTAQTSSVGEIEATIPIDGTVRIRIPLTMTSEGTLSPFAETLTPPASAEASGSVGPTTIVDLYLAARAEAASDIETTCVPENPTDTNWAHATATYSLLNWRSRPAPAAAPAPTGGAGDLGATGAAAATRYQVRFQMQAGRRELVPSETITQTEPITVSQGERAVDRLIDKATNRHSRACARAAAQMKATLRGYPPNGISCPPTCGHVVDKMCDRDVEEGGYRLRIDFNNDAGHNFRN